MHITRLAFVMIPPCPCAAAAVFILIATSCSIGQLAGLFTARGCECHSHGCASAERDV